jgi:trk system potassium uptake protein TrkA
VYAIIVGGGKIGYYLGRTLLENRHEVLVIEKGLDRYRHLEEVLGEVVVHGDGADVRVLEKAGITRADVVVAVTGYDEDNLVICQMAKRKFGTRRVVARVNNPLNEDTFRMLGIDATVSSTRIIYNLLEEEVGPGTLVCLAALRRGRLEIIEVGLANDSPMVGKAVKELRLPLDCILLSVVRGEELIVPRGDTVIQGGDSIVALVRQDGQEALRSALGIW